jgi:hypothetical protein
MPRSIDLPRPTPGHVFLRMLANAKQQRTLELIQKLSMQVGT